MSGSERNVVALETATETVGVAIRTASGVSAEFVLTGRRRHVETLMPALDHLLKEVGLSAPDIGTVAVDVGPGLFTGLRVGVAAAKGLALALGVGVITERSTDIVVRAASEAGARGLVLAVLVARRGEVFAHMRRVESPDGSGPDLIPLALVTPEVLAAQLGAAGISESDPVLACGDGARRYAEVLETVPGVCCTRASLLHPPPGTLVSMALDRLESGASVLDAAAVAPLYMRDADARSNFAQVGSG